MMGREIPLKVNTKRFGASKKTECMEEMSAFFQCMQVCTLH